MSPNDPCTSDPLKTTITKLGKELWADIGSSKVVAAFSAGASSGVGMLATHIAFATYIFAGPLAPYVSQGVGLVLCGCFAACLVTALGSSFRGTIAALSPTLLVPMALIASTMGATDASLFVSVVAALILCAVLIGIFCIVIGRFQLANLVRFIPYPVAMGFVAGIGCAVCLASMSLMVPDWDGLSISFLMGSDVVWRWLPGIIFGIGLYLIMKRWRYAWILPTLVVLPTLAFHVALAMFDLTGADARAAGLLLGGTGGGQLWHGLSPADFFNIEWLAVAAQIPNMLVLGLVALIAIIMNISGLEAATNQELNWDREFSTSGYASLFAGLGGGTVATIVVSASLRSKLLGATSRLTGVIAALVVGSALIMGDGILDLVPAALLGGMLVFAGLGMLDEGLVRAYKQIPHSEMAVIVLIVCVINGVGLLEGVGFGMTMILVFFAIRLSRVDPIISVETVRNRRSGRVRPVPEHAILAEAGDQVQIYRLRGYIFFGSVYPLSDRLRQVLNDDSPPLCVMLDFIAVSGVDPSAVNVLARLFELAHDKNVQVVVCTSSALLTSDFKRNVSTPVFERLVVESNEEQALERSEDVLISKWNADLELAAERRETLLAKTADTMEKHLERQIVFEELVEQLNEWSILLEFDEGEELPDTATSINGMHLLLSGIATAYDAAGVRLYQCGPGDSLRPTRAIAEKVVSIIAETPCRSIVLPIDVQLWLAENRQSLLLKLYEFLLDDMFHPETS